MRERRLDMKKRSINKDDQDIPEFKREQLGAGVRGKYHKQFMQGSNVVVLQPEIQKAFPTSEAVNKALASMLAFTRKRKQLLTLNERLESELRRESACHESTYLALKRLRSAKSPASVNVSFRKGVATGRTNRHDFRRAQIRSPCQDQ